MIESGCLGVREEEAYGGLRENAALYVRLMDDTIKSLFQHVLSGVTVSTSAVFGTFLDCWLILFFVCVCGLGSRDQVSRSKNNGEF